MHNDHLVADACGKVRQVGFIGDIVSIQYIDIKVFGNTICLKWQIFAELGMVLPDCRIK
jgi:hypothetical protein